MGSERKHGFHAEPVPVSAYVGRSKSLKDLKVRSAIAEGRALRLSAKRSDIRICFTCPSPPPPHVCAGGGADVSRYPA